MQIASTPELILGIKTVYIELKKMLCTMSEVISHCLEQEEKRVVMTICLVYNIHNQGR